MKGKGSNFALISVPSSGVYSAVAVAATSWGGLAAGQAAEALLVRTNGPHQNKWATSEGGEKKRKTGEDEQGADSLSKLHTHKKKCGTACQLWDLGEATQPL